MSPARLKPLPAACLALALANPVYAAQQICKYIDGEGRPVYSTSPQKDARRVMCFDPVPDSAPRPAPKAAPDKATRPTPGFPRVDGETQKRRDTDRRRILEQELADEEKLLEQARASLRDSESVRYANETTEDKARERIRPLQDAVLTHEKNIGAIRREIANIR